MLEEAKEAYKKAIQLDPDYCDAMDNLGRLLRGEGDLDGAIGWYQKSLKIFPENIVAQGNLGLAYRIKGDTVKAIKAYQAVIDIDGKDPEGYYGLGSIYFDRQEYLKAKDMFLEAELAYKKKNSPYETHAQLYLGHIHFKLKNFSQAITYYELSYRTLHNDPIVNFHLGLCYLTEEAYDLGKARNYIAKAEKLGMVIEDQIKTILSDT
jgi:tetratricopeptide (TPR) repeat protein